MRKEQTAYNGKEWLKKEMRPYRGAILLLTLLTSLATLFSLAFAYLVKYVINSATEGKSQLLWTFSAVLLSLLLLKILFKTIDSFYAEKLRAKIVARLRTKIFTKLLQADYAQTSLYHSGELLNRLTSDIQEIASYTVGLLPVFSGMMIQCAGAIALLVTINPLFTAIYVVCGGVFGLLAALFRRQIKKRQRAFLEADDAHRAFMQEGISSAMTIKAYGAEKKSTQKSEALAQNYYEKRMKRNLLRTGMSALFTLLSNAGLIFAIVWCGVSILNHGNTNYGEMLAVILLLMQFQQPLSGFSSVIPAYYARIASGERLAEIEAIPSEDLSAEEALSTLPQAIAFENLSFSYGREEVLLNANAIIQTGETVCLTGASGTGKSTLFKLLLCVYAPTEGRVVLNGDYGKIPLRAEHRKLFAYVPQGNFLFSGTIYENLTFFVNEEAGQVCDEKINAALKSACADFVFELPKGLQTPLSERGGGLSEGQQQRLAVARAILSDRPILLLDEATSALDSETERKLLENIKNLQDKTCIIVTHRPAALAIADRVLTIENRQIKETNS